MGQNQVESDTAMFIPDVHAWFKERGFKYSLRQVRRMATEKKLPFVQAPNGRDLFIWRSVLVSKLAPQSDQG
jgi:hypothetical protein